MNNTKKNIVDNTEHHIVILSYCQYSYNNQQYLTIFLPVLSKIAIALSAVLEQYCHQYRIAASTQVPSTSALPALPLLNRSHSKSLFALCFSNQAVVALPLAGPCVRGSQWQALSLAASRRVR